MIPRVRVWVAAMTVIVAGQGIVLAEPGMHVWVAPDTCKVNPRNGNVLEEHSFARDPSIEPPSYVKRKTDKPLPPGSLMVGPLESYYLRAQVVNALQK